MSWILDDLTKDLSEFLGEAEQEIQRRLSSQWYSQLQPQTDYREWLRKSPYFLYDLAQWHIAERSNFLRLLENLPQVDHLKCLDFGSGVGTRSLIHSLKGWDMTLCEVNEPCRLFAEYRFLKHNLNLSSMAMLRHFNYFDRVLLIDVVGHLEEPEKTLREVTASMKRGATLEVTWDLFEPPNPTHLWFSDRKEEFKGVLRKLGLEERGGETIWTKK